MHGTLNSTYHFTQVLLESKGGNHFTVVLVEITYSLCTVSRTFDSLYFEIPIFNTYHIHANFCTLHSFLKYINYRQVTSSLLALLLSTRNIIDVRVCV